MTSSETQELIALSLQTGALTCLEIADAVGQAPFCVRGELQAMQREKHVRSTYVKQRGLEWELTTAGHQAITERRQLRLV